MKFLFFFLLFCRCILGLELTDGHGNLKPAAKGLLELFEIPSNQPLLDIVARLQKEWMQEGKERWEMKKIYEEKKFQAFPFLCELGCIYTIQAEKIHYDHALLLGALGKTMQRRLDFLWEQWQRGVRFDHLFLLTGARDLDPKIESFPANLKTETELFCFLFSNHPLSKAIGHIPVVVINSKKQEIFPGYFRRPNTASTIRDWLATNPKLGSCLIVSTQPFIGYQESIAKCFASQWTIEAIGPGSSDYPSIQNDFIKENPDTMPLAVYLDAIAKWLTYEVRRFLSQQ